MEAPDFWDDTERSQNAMKELKSLKDDVETYQKLTDTFEEIEILLEMGYDENDAAVLPEIEEQLAELEREYEDIKIKTLLSGEYDKDNAILTLHSGAGGTEACDWVSMLYRMYLRWAESKG